MSWEYIAGFFDGEGNVRLDIGSGKMNAKMSFHQADERGRVLLTIIQEFMAEHGIVAKMHRNKRPTPTGKPMYRLYIYNRAGVMALAAAIMPYIHIKKLETQDVVRYLKIFPSLHAHYGACRRPTMQRARCAVGHDLTDDNVYLMKPSNPRYSPSRVCKTCASTRSKDYIKTFIAPIAKAYGIRQRDVRGDILIRGKRELGL